MFSRQKYSSSSCDRKEKDGNGATWNNDHVAAWSQETVTLSITLAIVLNAQTWEPGLLYMEKKKEL